MIVRLMIAVIFFFTQAAVASEDSFYNCRKIAETQERVNCYDNLVDAAQSKPVEYADRLPEFDDLFGKQESEVLQIVKESLTATENNATQTLKFVDQIEAEVTSVRKSSARKLTVTLANGQIWQQLDNSPMPLKQGEIVTVRSARLGSYLMRKQNGGGSIRVKRRN